MIVIIGCLAITAMVKLLTADKSNNVPTVITGGLLLFLMSAFRSVDFGFDTIRYVNTYILQSYESLATFWFKFTANRGKDPFFYLFGRVLSALGANYRVWLAIMAAFFLLAVSRLILKYSKEPFMSFLLFVTLGYFFFSLTGIRQALAMAVTMFAYKYLNERKLAPFIILVLIASLFHSSALVFLFAYPVMSLKKIGWKQVLAIILALFSAYFLSAQFKMLIALLGWSDSVSLASESNATLTISGFLIQLAIFLFCMYFRKTLLAEDKKASVLYNLLFMGVAAQAFAVVVAESFRVSLYFSIYSIILLPNAVLSEENNQTKVLAYTGTLGVVLIYLFAYYLRKFAGYNFFWQ